ncbi:MAG TPA: DUF6677 family protein [Phycisphaerae bacterium]|nr:DUF6677 family protein [Phycisphaerae bacterium]
MTVSSDMPPVARVPLAGLLAWLVPGLGHFFVGERVRGLIYLITITVTFWGGIAIGGVRDTVDPKGRTTWFMAQTCAGLNGLAAYGWAESLRQHPEAGPAEPGHHRSVETAVVYTGVAGLLNLLAILDALVRADYAPTRSRRAEAVTVKRAGP